MNGRLSNWPILSTIPASKSTWSFFTNSISNLTPNSATSHHPKMVPVLKWPFFLM